MPVSQNVDGRDESVGARPLGAPPARRGIAAWLVPLLLLVAGAVVVLLLLSQCGGSSDAGSRAAAISATTVAAASPATAPTPSATGSGAGDSGADAGTISADGSTVLPLTGSSTSSLSKFAGEDAKTASVEVQSVPADEGFWVGTGRSDRVWVQLIGQAGESPYKVKIGDSVTFTGRVTKNAPGFARKVGVTAGEGRAQLDAQGYHIEVPEPSLKLAS